MKIKLFCLILVLLLALTGCSPLVEQAPEKAMSVYATFYPVYALANLITEDVPDVELHCLVQPQDDCLRSYELSDWDVYLLAYAADILLAAGNGLEGFQDRLEQIGETSLPVAEVFYGLQETVFTENSDEDSHFTGANPHVYMSLDGARGVLESISRSLSLLDAKNAAQYDTNLALALEKMDEIEDYIRKQTEVCNGVRVAVLHECLFYPAQDYGMEIAAWYGRESGEMLYDHGLDECLQILREKRVEVVLIEKQAPKALSDALTEAGYSVARLDVMSTLGENDSSTAYLEALKKNAERAADACRR